MAFLTTPNLPRHRVTLVAVSVEAVQSIAWLTHHGIQVVPIAPDPRLAFPVCSHADMLVHHMGNQNIISASQSKTTIQFLEREGFSLCSPDKSLSETYPGDILLNALRLGNYLIGKLTALDPVLIRQSEEQGIRLIDCAQGYARCACAVISEKAVVTADPSLEKILVSLGMDVLRISSGFIRLPGYSYGFLGGCCGLIAPDVLLFAGNLDDHPDAGSIRKFAASHGVKICCTSREPLTDVGGILPLKEEDVSGK